MFALAVGTLNVNVVLKIVHDYSSLSYFLIRNYIKKIIQSSSIFRAHFKKSETIFSSLFTTNTRTHKKHWRVGGHNKTDKNRFLIISWKADDEILSPLNNKIF